jgi:hypothetical protein
VLIRDFLHPLGFIPPCGIEDVKELITYLKGEDYKNVTESNAYKPINLTGPVAF